MKEPQYKPITGMINVNDIQEIIESNRYYQEEIERLKEEYMILQNASDKVEEEKDKEIERLQDLCNKYEKEHKTTYEIWKKDIYLYNSLVDRIDKAIEYIEERKNLNWYADGVFVCELLNILQGSDKE